MLISSYIFVSLTPGSRRVRAHNVLYFLQLEEFKTYSGNEEAEVSVKFTEVSSRRKRGSGNFSEDLLEFIQEGGKRGGVCRHFWPESSKIFV